MGPKVLRPNSEYHVAVSTQGTTAPTTVVVDVGGKQDSGGVLKVTQFVKVDPYSTRIVRLEVSARCASTRKKHDFRPFRSELTSTVRVEGKSVLFFFNRTRSFITRKRNKIVSLTKKKKSRFNPVKFDIEPSTLYERKHSILWQLLFYYLNTMIRRFFFFFWTRNYLTFTRSSCKTYPVIIIYRFICIKKKK